MNILSLDTTSPAAGVVIMKDGVTAAQFTSSSPSSHSVKLLPMIDAAMNSTGMEAGDIDLYACCSGPGSFTGVRIGVSMIKGLAMKDSVPAVGVSTIEAMARGMSLADGVICPVMNARRGQVYTGVFLSDKGKLRRLTADSLVMLSSLVSLLSGGVNDFEFVPGAGASDLPEGAQIYFTGDACEMAKDATAGLPVADTPAHMRFPGAAGAALIAEEMYLAATDKSVFAPGLLLPIYLRKPQAQREYEERIAAEAIINKQKKTENCVKDTYC